MKRSFDLIVACIGLLIFGPVLWILMICIWCSDRHNPLYIAPRVGLKGSTFNIVKLRSMIVNADQSGVDSTSGDDKRITKLGHFIRKYKIDEIIQLWNVFKGDMSLVGPRPNVKREVDLYTKEERKLLTVRPGITDFSSIVFSDEGEILFGTKDPDIVYNQLIRPYKSSLGLFYIKNQNFLLDVKLCVLTLIAIFSKQIALSLIVQTLKHYGASDRLLKVAARSEPLIPSSPPGSNKIITSRK